MKKVSIAENLNQDFPEDNSHEDCHIQEDPNIQGINNSLLTSPFIARPLEAWVKQIVGKQGLTL